MSFKYLILYTLIHGAHDKFNLPLNQTVAGEHVPPTIKNKALVFLRKDLQAFDLLLKDKHGFVCR